jgi:hypothetical protein
MAFSYIDNTVVQGTYAQTFMTTFMNSLDTLDGWSIHDNQITGSGQSYFVMKMLTSEGVGNELYPWFGYNTGTTGVGCMEHRVTDSWNATTHVAGSSYLWSGYTVFSNTASTVDPVQYSISGDSDHAIVTFNTAALGAGNINKYLPFYVGLVDKIMPTIDTATKGAVLLYRYGYNNRLSAYNSTDNRSPWLYGSTGVFLTLGYPMPQYPNKYTRSQGIHQFMLAGPHHGDNTYISSKICIWDNTFGPRGYLKSVESIGDQTNVALTHKTTVTIQSKTYYVWKTYETDASVANENPWGNYVEAGNQKQVYLIRMA